jgi:hypothetical protein
MRCVGGRLGSARARVLVSASRRNRLRLSIAHRRCFELARKVRDSRGRARQHARRVRYPITRELVMRV